MVEWGFVVANNFATGGPTSAVTSTDLRSIELEAVLAGPVRAGWRVEFPIGLIVDAQLRNTALGPANIFPVPPRGEWRVPVDQGRTTARGLGVRPVGARLVGGPAFLEFQTEVGLGALFFDVPTPASNTSRLNLTAEFGFGVRVGVPGGRLKAGYRLHHLSNAGRGRVNPAVDSHMYYLGMSFH